jgi:histidinol-phosphate aminotransferase
VIILRSFSKSFSLAGARIGYGLASEEIIRGLIKVKDSYNVNRFAVAAGVAALDDVEYMRCNVAKIRSERKRLAEALEGLGFLVHPSHANFVAAVCQEGRASGIADALAEQGIWVRTFGAPELKDWLRITIGTPEQNDRLLAEIERVLGSKRP